ncbi:integrase/recombinase xerD homolog [Podarcis muralis]
MESVATPSRCGSSLVKRRQHRRAHAATLGTSSPRIFLLRFRGSRSLRVPSRPPYCSRPPPPEGCLVLLSAAAASRKSCPVSFSDGPLPLVSTRRTAASSAVPGTSVESWGPESWEPEVIQGVLASLAPSTLRSYKRAWSDFLKFRVKTCAARSNAPPVKSEVLSYLVYLRRLGRAPKTLNLQASAISFFCKVVFSSDPCADFVIRKTLEGLRRLQPPSCDMRRPISFDILFQIHKKLRTVCWSKYEARLFSAAYSIAFFGAMHIGEVVYEEEEGQRGSSRALLLSDVTLSREDLVLRILNSKTDQYGRGALVRLLATGKPGPCPVKDTRRFLFLRANSAGPLLIHADGLPLTRHQFTRVMRLALAACGLPPADFAAHSFRIGAATTAMHLGLTAERIKDLGSWKSDAYKRYVRKNL